MPTEYKTIDFSGNYTESTEPPRTPDKPDDDPKPPETPPKPVEDPPKHPEKPPKPIWAFQAMGPV